jgi:dihydrofolate synthase/folylpolyglutamate synthase
MQLVTLRDAERYLDGLVNLERRIDFDYASLGLGRIRALLDATGNPERGLACLHIAGSKGKGTVALASEALLVSAGVRVGTFTSPHLTSWVERFRIDGADVAAEPLLAALERILPAVETLRADERLRPSFFDVSTALALHVFRDLGVRVAVMEVGLGGRLDSTNAVDSKISVITSIQLEHTDKLGRTHAAIAGEKAGILRPGVPVVHGPMCAEALAVIRGRAEALGAPCESIPRIDATSSAGGIRFTLPDGRVLHSSVLGEHQATNLAIAIRSVERVLGRALSGVELAALSTLRLSARIEPFGRVILDSAHTPDSARALRGALVSAWPRDRWILVLAISADKDARAILSELAPLARACVVTSTSSGRTLAPERLAQVAREVGIPEVEVRADPLTALERARRRAAALGDRIAIAGSVYLAGAVRPTLVKEQRGG